MNSSNSDGSNTNTSDSAQNTPLARQVDHSADNSEQRARVDLGPHGTNRPRKKVPIPQPLLLVGLVVILAGFAWITINGLDSPPMLVAQPTSGAGEVRLEIARATPAAATALSDSFIPASGELRARVLQRLAEFQAKWRIDGPIVALHAYDVHGDAVELVGQFESWLAQSNLVTSDKLSTDDNGAVEIVGTDLPAPTTSGLLLRFNEEDAAIAGDLAMAIAPAIGGEVNLLSDERVQDRRIVMAIVGAPSFADDGMAFFPR